MSFAKDVKRLEKKLGYKGCKNCKHQIAPLRRCEWAEQKTETHLHIICPKWEKREDGYNTQRSNTDSAGLY